MSRRFSAGHSDLNPEVSGDKACKDRCGDLGYDIETLGTNGVGDGLGFCPYLIIPYFFEELMTCKGHIKNTVEIKISRIWFGCFCVDVSSLMKLFESILHRIYPEL